MGGEKVAHGFMCGRDYNTKQYVGKNLSGFDLLKERKKILSGYNVRIEHTGESMDNLLKIFYTERHYSDVSLFVQTSPAFCCPSLVTEAMAKKIEQRTGVPVVSITYDGTSSNKNEALVPYLAHLNRKGD